jgi:hypothetical protein
MLLDALVFGWNISARPAIRDFLSTWTKSGPTPRRNRSCYRRGFPRGGRFERTGLSRRKWPCLMLAYRYEMGDAYAQSRRPASFADRGEIAAVRGTVAEQSITDWL